MKKAFQLLTAIALLLAITVPAHAQSRKVIYLQSYDKALYHYGFLLGANFMGYSIKPLDLYQAEHFDGSWLPSTVHSNYAGEYDLHGYSESDVDHFNVLCVESNPILQNLGFSVGFIGDLRLSNCFNLRLIPTLSLGSREIRYYLKLYDSNDNLIRNTDGETIQKARSLDILATYAELPIHVKYRSHRYNNIGAYLIAGVNPKFFLFSRAPKTPTQNPDESSDPGQTQQTGNDAGNQPKFMLPKRADVALEIGAGYDIYNQWFKMGVELKLSMGMFNLLREGADYEEFLYQAPINYLRNKQLQISFTFE